MVEEDQVTEHLNRLDTHTCTVPDQLHPQVLREMTHVIVMPFLSIFGRSLQMEEVPETWGKSKYPPYLQEGPKGGSRKLQTDQPHLSLREGDWEQIIQDTISRYFEEKVTGNSQHVFMKGKSCVTNLITFYNEMTGLVDEWEVVVVYLHFSKGFDTIICKILKQTDEA